MSDRCTGHCCRKFNMYVTIQDLKDDLAKAPNGKHDPIECAKLIEMLIPLGVNAPVEGYFYTCKHLDTVTGDCTNYANRPLMCRDYPSMVGDFEDACQEAKALQLWDNEGGAIFSAPRLNRI